MVVGVLDLNLHYITTMSQALILTQQRYCVMYKGITHLLLAMAAKQQGFTACMASFCLMTTKQSTVGFKVQGSAEQITQLRYHNHVICYQ